MLYDCTLMEKKKSPQYSDRNKIINLMVSLIPWRKHCLWVSDWFHVTCETFRFQEAVIYRVRLPGSLWVYTQLYSFLSKEANESFLRWRQLITIPNLLFSRGFSLYIAVSSFTFKHREHLLVVGLYGWCFLSISQVKLAVWWSLLMSHIALDSSGSEIYIVSEWLNMAHKSLFELVSVMPYYIIGWYMCWFDVKVALHKMLLCKHFSWSTQFVLFMQLYVFSLVFQGIEDSSIVSAKGWLYVRHTAAAYILGTSYSCSLVLQNYYWKVCVACHGLWNVC